MKILDSHRLASTGVSRFRGTLPSPLHLGNYVNLSVAWIQLRQGLLAKRMLANPGSEDHQWEGCKGLADLASRDSEGLSAVRRQGGIQVW